MLSIRSGLSVIAAWGLVLAGGAKADLIPVVNAGFEATPLADGAFTRVAPPGWTLVGTGGTFHPSVRDFPGGAPEGQNTGYSSGGSLSQTLVSPLQAGVYTLRVEVGDSFFTPFPGYKIELLAGSFLLAQDNNSLAPANGTFLTSTVMFAATAGDARLGQPLSIRLTSSGSETNFDNIRLDFAPSAVPEPASVMMLGIGALGLLGYDLRRRLKGRA